MKFKRFFKKYVVFFVTCALIGALLCFPVSANTVSGTYFVTMPISSPNISDNFSYIEVVTQNSSNGNLLGYTIFLNTNGGGGYLNVVNTKTITVETYDSSSMIAICSDGDVFNKGSFSSGGTFSLGFGYNIVSIMAYGDIFYKDLASYNVLSVNFVYGADNVSVNYLALILAALNGQSNSDIIQNANQNAQNIQNNQDQNTSEIIQNQNNNTQSQIDNDNEIKNEILYGSTFDDSTASDKAFGEYDDVEAGLIDGTQSNSDKATQEVNDNFIGSIQRNVSGLAAVSGMFTDMLLTKIPDLNTIVWFSLAMGIVPLLVGLSVQGLRSSDRAAARSRRKRKGG